jgi:SUMO ligase MMS21 Smc5/6 complex component
MALVNQVRTRVLLANIVPATSENDAIDKILKERFLELAFEGQRWFDLKREGKTVEVLSQQKYLVYDPATQSSNQTLMPYIPNLDSKDLLLPVPQSAIDNNSNLSQNPGY